MPPKMKTSPNKFLTKIILLSIFGRTIFVAQNLVNCIFVCSIGEYCPVVTKQINFLSLSCFNHFTFYALSHISPFTVVSVFQQIPLLADVILERSPDINSCFTEGKCGFGVTSQGASSTPPSRPGWPGTPSSTWTGRTGPCSALTVGASSSPCRSA